METAQDGAVCARHAGAVAVGVCERCGNFMCERCIANGARTICSMCEEKTRFVPLAVDAPFAERLSAVWRGFKGNAGVLIAAVAIYFVAELVTDSAAEGWSIQSIVALRERRFEVATEWWGPLRIGVRLVLDLLVHAPVDAVLLVGLWRIALEAAQGRAARISQVFDVSRISGALALALSLRALRLPLDCGSYALQTLGVPVGLWVSSSFSGSGLRILLSRHDEVVLNGIIALQLTSLALFPLHAFSMLSFVEKEARVGEALGAAVRLAWRLRAQVLSWWLWSATAVLSGVLALGFGLVVSGPLVLLVWCSLFLSLRAAVNR